MAIAERVISYIDKRRIPYDIHELVSFISLLQAAELGEIPPGSIAKGVVIKDEVGLLLVVLPATHRVDTDALSKQLHRKVELADEEEIKAAFPDCLPRFVAPIGEAYGVRTIVDDSLVGATTVYFSAGDASRLIEISGKEFFGFLGNARLARDFARPIADNGKHIEQLDSAENAEDIGPTTESEIMKRVQQLKDMPAIPQMAQKIIELRMDPHGNSEMLAKVVELDPSMAARSIRYTPPSRGCWVSKW